MLKPGLDELNEDLAVTERRGRIQGTGVYSSCNCGTPVDLRRTVTTSQLLSNINGVASEARNRGNPERSRSNFKRVSLSEGWSRGYRARPPSTEARFQTCRSNNGDELVYVSATIKSKS
jgi:hypothetical protein